MLKHSESRIPTPFFLCFFKGCFVYRFQCYTSQEIIDKTGVRYLLYSYIYSILNSIQGCGLDSNETEEWNKLIKEYLSPDEESFEKQKEVHELMLSLRNNVYFLFFLINALFVTSIFMMTQVNEFKGNIQISIPCPNKDGMFEVEPISMIFIFTFGLTLLLQLIGMVIHRFNTFLHLAYDIFSRKGCSQTAQRENA